MSVEDLKTYGHRAVEDLTIRTRAKEIGLNDMAGHIEYANTLGLQISEDDFRELARSTIAGEELSEEQLAQVAGGAVAALAAAVAAVVIAVGVGGGVASVATGEW